MNFLIWTSSLFIFLKTFLLVNSISLCFDPWVFCHPLTSLSPTSWTILVVFWMLWILVTVHKPCHVPHASWITTWETTFIEGLFSVSREWVKSRSHAFLITYDKTLTKKLLAVCPEKMTRRKKIKNKKTRMAIAKLFALYGNAVSSGLKWSQWWIEPHSSELKLSQEQNCFELSWRKTTPWLLYQHIDKKN